MLMLILLACDSGLLLLPYAPDWSQASAGRLDACAVRTDSYLVCQTAVIDNPSEITSGFEVTEDFDQDHRGPYWGGVAAGEDVACAITTEGVADCWGDAENPIVSADLSGLPPLKPSSLTLGMQHACALDEDGLSVCWGDDSQGQTGAPEGELVSLAAGLDHTCGLSADGQLSCWGGGGAAYATATMDGIRAVGAADGLTCTLSERDEIRCQDAEDSWTPELDGEGQVAVFAGELGVCLLNEGGRLRCDLATDYADTELPGERLAGLSLSGWRDFGCGVSVRGRLVCFGSSAPDLEGWD